MNALLTKVFQNECVESKIYLSCLLVFTKAFKTYHGLKTSNKISLISKFFTFYYSHLSVQLFKNLGLSYINPLKNSFISISLYFHVSFFL